MEIPGKRKNTDFVGENGNCNGKIIQNSDGIETEK